VPEVFKYVLIADARPEKSLVPKFWDKSNLGVIVFAAVFVASVIALLAAMGR